MALNEIKVETSKCFINAYFIECNSYLLKHISYQMPRTYYLFIKKRMSLNRECHIHRLITNSLMNNLLLEQQFVEDLVYTLIL